VSTGNLLADDRVSLILMDYVNRMCLKILGHARIAGPDDPVVLDALGLPDTRARVERGILIDIAALDWNCPAHITPRYTVGEIEAVAGTGREDS